MPAPRPSKPRARATRVGRATSWWLGLGLAAIAAAGPALAEAGVQSRLRERFGVDEGFAVDLDLRGLELRGLSRALPGQRGHLSATRVQVRPGFEGFTIEIEGLEGVVLPAAAKPSARASGSARADASPRAASPALNEAPAPADPIARALQRVRGVPIELITHGHVRVELADGISVMANDPHLLLPGDGELRGDVEIRFEPTAPSTQASWARATIEFVTTDAAPRSLALSGTLALDGVEPGSALAIDGRVSPHHAALELREPAGGRASINFTDTGDTPSDANTQAGQRLTLEAVRLPLAWVEPIAQLLGRRLTGAIGERDAHLMLDDTRLTGTVELTRATGLTRARFDDVELSTLRVDSGLLAAAPVEFTQLTIDGELAREHTKAGPRSSGALVIGHRGVQVELSGQLDPAGLNVNLELPSSPCQAVFDATPGMSAVLAGTELSGELEAHVALRLDFAALERARARYLGPEAEPLELEHFEAPGQLRFDLPYLERCKIERLGSGADVEGLRGAYHHRFVSAAGREQRRVLALGDDDYVRIDQVPTIALAFVILEDARFWQHDGFDREQIERAFWFNLLERRVSRGASTITQQAARSLWLGIDRSITRKLAEAMLAAELERGLGKRRILEVYLNVIELGPEIHGVVEAARYHFDKEPAQLDLLEALHLASMAPAPVAYSRRFASGKIDREWREHLRRQVRRLRIRHLISPETAERAMAKSLRLRAHM